MTYDLLWSHPVLRRIDREFDLTPHSDGWTLPCPGCDAEAEPRGLFSRDPDANYATVVVALSEDGQRLRIRRCGRGCSALRIAVALNLELKEFEPWDAPTPAPAPAAPRAETQAPKPSRPSGPRPVWQSDADTYSALRTCVQAVLNAPARERARVVREQREAAMAIPGLPAAKAHGAISAAAKAAGMSEGDAERAMEVWV